MISWSLLYTLSKKSRSMIISYFDNFFWYRSRRLDGNYQDPITQCVEQLGSISTLAMALEIAFVERLFQIKKLTKPFSRWPHVSFQDHHCPLTLSLALPIHEEIRGAFSSICKSLAKPKKMI